MANKYDVRDDEFFGFEDETFDDDKLDRVLDEIQEIKNTIQGLPEADMLGDGYDEVTKLRDEVERSRVTESLRREIRRLSNRINDMDAERSEAGGRAEEVMVGAIERLIELTEEQIQRGRETEERLSDEIGMLKKQIARANSGNEVVTAVNALKTDVKNASDFIASISATLDGMSSTKGGQPQNANHEAATELLRQIYELKSLVGSPSPLSAKRNDEMLDLYNLLAKVKYDARIKSVSIVDKFASVDALAKRLQETNESDIQPIVDALNAVITELNARPLTLTTFDALAENASMPYVNISVSRRDAVLNYLDTVSQLVKDGTVESMDDLPDIIALKNDLQNGRNELECESAYSAVLNTNIALLSEKDPARQRALRTQLKQQITALTSLQIRDLAEYPTVSVVKAYRAPKNGEGEGLFDRLGEIRSYMLDANIAQSGGVISEASGNGLVNEINSLKNELYSINSIDNVSQAILDLKGDCLTILEKLEDQKSGEVGTEVIAGIPTINEIVSQLDRLFDDIKNLVTDSENNIMGAVEVVAEALKNIAEEGSAAKADREKLMSDVAAIKAMLEGNAPVVAASEVAETAETASEPVAQTSETAESVPSENGNSDISARLDAIEANQQKILEVLGTLAAAGAAAPVVAKATNDDVIAEIKLLRDQLFAISMANVTEDGESSYESYNSLILNEVYDVADTLDAIKDKLDGVEETDDSKISEELAALKADITAAIDKSNDNDGAVIDELNKLKEEVAKRPVPPVRPTPPPRAPRPPMPDKPTLPTKRKKTVVPVTAANPVSALLTKIANTETIEIPEE